MLVHTGGKGDYGILWMITVLCRPLILISGTKKLRTSFTGLLRTITAKKGAVAFVIATLFLSIWVFVWMGMVLFARTPEGRKDFFSWADGVASMWILFTTANDPNDWIPAYTSYKISVFFFIIFLCLMLYLLLNLLLANVYQAYKSLLEDDLYELEGATKFSLGEAYKNLRNGYDGNISPESFDAFIHNFCDPYIGQINASDPTLPKYNVARCRAILKKTCRHMKDFDEKDSMGYPLFEEVMRFISGRPMFIPSPKDPAVKQFKSYCLSTRVFEEGFTVGGVDVKWDRMIDFIILIGVIITFWASVSFAAQKTPTDFSHFLSFQLLFAVAIFYTLGISVKILSLGWERFWNRNEVQHRFDFFNVYLLIIATVTYFFIWSPQMLARVVILLHLFRGFRLLAYFEPLRGLFGMVSLLIPTFWQMFLVLFAVYYIFAVVGQYLFGGRIFTTNPVLAGTNFASAGFWPLNFNDLPSGFVTLFALMIVNNWYEIAQGFMLVTNSDLVSLYFVIFFVIVNLVVLNIVMALVIDCNSVLEDLMEREKGHMQRLQQKGVNDLEAGEGMGTPSAEYVMRRALQLDPSTPPSSDEEEEKSEPLVRRDRRTATRDIPNLEHMSGSARGVNAPLLDESTSEAGSGYGTLGDQQTTPGRSGRKLGKKVTLTTPILSPATDDEQNGA
jgi:hypothetical protein